MSEPPDEADEAALDAWLGANNAIDFVDINGPSSRDLYAVGDEAWHWNGQQWRQLALPTDEPLAAIKVLNTQEFAGHNGTLLLGNAADGFTELSSRDDNQNFTAVECYEGQNLPGRLFLASNLGLFTYDLFTKRIEPCLTGLRPEVQDSHVLEAKDGVLWSFGFKDLVHFNGRVWTRVDHPDNPPIR